MGEDLRAAYGISTGYLLVDTLQRWSISVVWARTARAVSVTNMARSGTPARLYVYDTLLERLAQDLEDMAAEHGQFIQEQHAMVSQRHVARHRHVAPAISPTSEMV